MRTKIVDLAVDLITQFEGFCSIPYICPAGKRTIGYGEIMTPKDKRKKITKEEGKVFVRRRAEEIYEQLQKLLPFGLEENQYVALISFIYNIGIGAFEHSTLLKKMLNNSPNNLLRTEWMKWVHSNGKVLKGLTIRRAKEWNIFAGIENVN